MKVKICSLFPSWSV